jgi:hypothetical protein
LEEVPSTKPLHGSRAEVLVFDDIQHDAKAHTSSHEALYINSPSGVATLAIALSRKAQAQPYRGIQPRGIGARAYARSQGFDNMQHMVRVMAARRVYMEQLLKQQQQST